MHYIFSIVIFFQSLLLTLLLIPFPVFSQKFTDQSTKSINSLYDEQSPCITPDGNSIYFTIAHHPKNKGGKRDPGDIWVSHWDGEKWLPPINIGFPLNNSDYNAVLGFSRTGNKIFLATRYSPNKTGNNYQGIAVSTQTGDRWGVPKNINIPYFVNYSNHLSGFINSATDMAVFSVQSYGSYGAEDIYYSVFDNGDGVTPVHFGKEINTKLQELSPSLSEDGQTLYFSTNSREGFGSFDIYISNRQTSNPSLWTEPVNLGSNVNTAGRELYFKMYDKWNIGIYTSTRNSNGYGDIRIFAQDNFTHPKKDLPTEMEIPLNKNSVIQNSILVKGKITDSKTGNPIQATLVFVAGNKIVAPVGLDGIYQVILSKNKDYTISIAREGYIESFEKTDFQNHQIDSTQIDFVLQPIGIGSRVKLKSVIFKQSTAELLPSSFAELDGVVHFLNSNPRIKILLGGHTDNHGDATKNLQLSIRRVNRVKSYLVSKGISTTRISGKGYGGSMPIATNDTEEMRSQNRRVEFIIVGQ